MQSKKYAVPVTAGKKVIIAVLFVVAGAITVSGMFFSFYSYINHITFQVINTQVSGILFGAVVLYLGVRYLVSLCSLKKELYKPTARFSWNNFKKNRKGSK